MKIDHNYILETLRAVSKILREENPVLTVNDDCLIIIGDLHGDLLAWEKIKKIIADHSCSAVFLGDYVDRGANSVEIAMELFELKIREPKRIFLLRGNHETAEVNDYYGFLYEIKRKYPSNWQSLYEKFNEVFSYLPLATVINGNILALHGGIPVSVPTLDTINSIPKGLVNASNDLLLQILWNDPDDNIKTYAPSPRGPGIYLFGEKIFNEFMEKNNLSLMIRAHTFLLDGYKYFFKGRLVSIFSVVEYVGYTVSGKIIILRNDKIDIMDLFT